MTIENTKKLSKHICRLLKVTEINYPIGRTPKGNLGIVFNVNTDDFDLMLDSVPLSTKSLIDDENNIELKKMVEKYWFDFEGLLATASRFDNPLPVSSSVVSKANVKELFNSVVSPEKKKGGRPVGSKNGKKAD